MDGGGKSKRREEEEILYMSAEYREGESKFSVSRGEGGEGNTGVENGEKTGTLHARLARQF